MRSWRIGLGACCLLAAALGCAAPKGAMTESQTHWSLEATPLDRSAIELENSNAEHLAWARARLNEIKGVEDKRTIANTLVPFNAMLMHVNAVSLECELFAQVHPDEAVREAAQAGEQEASRFITELQLDRELYEALTAVDVSRESPETQWFVKKTLRDFRRAGVERPPAVRERIRQLDEEIVRLGQTFQKNIAADQREITVDSPADLAGLPDDWIAKHPPDENGKIHIKTTYDDYIPFMTYAENAEARQALFAASRNRAYPQNIPVLDQLIARRHEKAQLLGYESWADYITEDKMIGSADNAQAFLDRLARIGEQAAERDYQMLLDRKREDVPGATSVAEWERGYYENRVKADRFAFDAQAVRPYFNYPDVLKGIFELTGDLFGIRYERVNGLDLWHDAVSAWDVYDGDKRLGRFYLDMHPRQNKYSHAACFPYRSGIEGVRLPQAALVCNFPDPSDSADGVALMEHDDVVTFFHEFGHLLHEIFAGHQPWIGNTGISNEWDFVEAPSQMLEEWCYSVEPLQVFGKHHETGKPIPAELVKNLREAAEFGKGVQNGHQLFYSAVSLNFYNRDPATIDTTKMVVELQDKYSPFDHVPETHFQCAFGHLYGYSAIYYTYRWSLVIAKDMFSKFEREGLMNERTAREYRSDVLDPGGSRPAAELVEDFLGRPYSFNSFEEWLNRS